MIGRVSLTKEGFTQLDFADDAVIFAENESDVGVFLVALHWGRAWRCESSPFNLLLYCIHP